MKRLLLAAAASITGVNAAHADELAEAVAQDYGYVFNLYKHFHENPELSFKESESARRMAAELDSLGFDVTTGVGDKWAKATVKAEVGEVLDGVGSSP